MSQRELLRSSSLKKDVLLGKTLWSVKFSREMSGFSISIPKVLPEHPPLTALGVQTCLQAPRHPVTS